MKGAASKIGITIVILAVLFFGLKGSTMTIWKSPDTPTTYAIHGSDGRSMTMIFLPNNETIILYTHDKAEFVEAALTKMVGAYGIHYFWRLWDVNVGQQWGLWFLGYRIYPPGAKPVRMEITVLKKIVDGTSQLSLRNEGESGHQVILFSENAVRFQNMWLEKEPTKPELVKTLLNKLKV
jgi:hypothetical protein